MSRLDVDVESGLAGIGHARHDHWLPGESRAHIAVFAQPIQHRVGRAFEHTRQRGGGIWPDHRYLREAAGDVTELHVFGEDELFELGQNGVLGGERRRQQHQVAELVDEQVGDHAALRRKVRGVTALSRIQRDDVVRQQSLQIRRAIGSGDDEAAAIGAVDARRVAARRLIGGIGNHGAMLKVCARSILFWPAPCS